MMNGIHPLRLHCLPCLKDILLNELSANVLATDNVGDYPSSVAQLIVEVQNVTAVLRPVRIIPPRTSYFSVGLGLFSTSFMLFNISKTITLSLRMSSLYNVTLFDI